MHEVFIVSACRTAIGGFGGVTLRAGEVAEAILCSVVRAGNDVSPARGSAIEAGVPEAIPAFTVNKACGSGMKAVALGAQAIMLGDAEAIVAGGMESMNRIP